jgi:mRNA-degrading endonuclease RelE of RelBE toxin-antitoxin system
MGSTSGGRKGTLSTPELKLFFILFYLKNYPTFDVLGCLVDISPAKAEENIIKLMPVLKQAEKRLHVLPRRHFKPASNNKQDNENIDKIIINVTERPYHRPHHDRKQKHYFSGKRRYHTLKNTVIADVKNGIPVVGPTAAGSRHDYALLKDELNPNQPGLSSVEVYVDLAYLRNQRSLPNFSQNSYPL